MSSKGFLSSFIGRFWPGRDGMAKVLGELEADVMEIAWRLQRVTVPDVLQALKPRRQLAYTTVMTVMTRLASKGLLIRSTDEKPYVYTPAVSRQEFVEGAVREVLDGLMEDFSQPTMAYFVNRIEKMDVEEARRLLQQIEEAAGEQTKTQSR